MIGHQIWSVYRWKRGWTDELMMSRLTLASKKVHSSLYCTILSFYAAIYLNSTTLEKYKYLTFHTNTFDPFAHFWCSSFIVLCQSHYMCHQAAIYCLYCYSEMPSFSMWVVLNILMRRRLYMEKKQQFLIWNVVFLCLYVQAFSVQHRSPYLKV